MKKILLFLQALFLSSQTTTKLMFVCLTLWASNGFAQSTLVNSGGVKIVVANATTLILDNVRNEGAGSQITNNATIFLKGNFVQNTGAIYNASTNNWLELQGTTTQTLNSDVTLALARLRVNKATGDVQLLQNLSVSDQVHIQQGDLDLNGKNVDLGTAGMLNEDITNNHIIKDNIATNDANQGGAILVTNRNVTNVMTNIAGLGYELQRTMGADYNVNISRYHYRGTSVGIKKVYQVTGTVTGTNTTVKINYTNDELAGINPSNLRIYRWSNAIAPLGWSEVKAPLYAGAVLSSGTNFVQVTNINVFSHWTLGDENLPLPITLLSFEGKRTNESNVLLQWRTATELNNKGFEIESSKNSTSFTKIAFVDGAGNSTNIRNYQFNVQNSDDTYYRLKQIDFDGSFSYSNIIFVKGIENIISIYPNPTTENINIKTSKEGFVYEIFTLQGNSLIKNTATSNTANINIKSFSKGIYFVHIIQNNNRVVKKIVVE